MERWLSKSRVLLGLCGVLLVAALNRQDPMVYGMFLMLTMVSMLGFLLPWLSLRSMTVRLDTAVEKDVIEGEDCDLGILVQRTAPWPAFMVDIETEWEWASQRMVLRQTVPVIRAGRSPTLSRMVQFPCRGNYELVAVRLSSGFPLGLMRAQYTLSRPNIHVRVLPLAQTVHWPLPWSVAEDPLGELTTRRMGQSFELGMLRPYQHGESVGRVSWRASARVGELVIQHFQQSGSIRLRVVLDVPREPALGDPHSAAEQAVRLAIGVGDAALAHGARLYLYLTPVALAMRDSEAVRQALAAAVSTGDNLSDLLVQVTQDAVLGEQIAVVISGDCSSEQLLMPLAALTARGCHVVVCIALGRDANVKDLAQAGALQLALEQAGFTTFMETP